MKRCFSCACKDGSHEHALCRIGEVILADRPKDPDVDLLACFDTPCPRPIVRTIPRRWKIPCPFCKQDTMSDDPCWSEPHDASRPDDAPQRI